MAAQVTNNQSQQNQQDKRFADSVVWVSKTFQNRSKSPKSAPQDSLKTPTLLPQTQLETIPRGNKKQSRQNQQDKRLGSTPV